MLRRAFRCCLLLLGVLPFAAQASPSPEFHQLLLEINGRLENLAPVITRGPECASNVVERAKEALQGNVATTALTKVVVEPLEAGAKVAAGALGIPAAAISTYSLVRCGMNESTAEGFAACVGGELAGYAGGKALEKAGVGNLEGAIAGLAWDKAYGAVRGAIEDYARKSESVEWTARGSCQTKLSAYWNRRPRPEARGGVIVVHAQFAQCECRTRKQATAGSLRFVVPVHYTPAGNSQPGWSTGTPKQYLVEAQCCGQRKWDEQTYQYDESGEWVNKSRDDAPAKPQPPRTDSPAVRDTGSAADPWPPRPSKPARLPPPKPEPVWSVENPCPVCEPFKELMEVHLSAAQDEESKAASLEGELAKNAAEQEAARARIAQLQEQLRMLEGQGGSAYDPATGLTTTAVTQADGTVLITVTDKQGREIERRTRDRRDSAQIRGRIADEEASLDALQRAAEQLQKDLAYQRALAAKQRKLADDELRALKHCLVEQCNQDPARIFDRTALVVPAETGVQTGRAPGGEAKPKKDILPEIEPDAHLKDHAPDAGSGDAAQPKEDILSEIEPDQAVPDRVPGAEVKPKEDILAEIEPVTAADNTGKAGAAERATASPATGAAAGQSAADAQWRADFERDPDAWSGLTFGDFSRGTVKSPCPQCEEYARQLNELAPQIFELESLRGRQSRQLSPELREKLIRLEGRQDSIRKAFIDCILRECPPPAYGMFGTTQHLWLAGVCPECSAAAERYKAAREKYDELRGIPMPLRGEAWKEEFDKAFRALEEASKDYYECIEDRCWSPVDLRERQQCLPCDDAYEKWQRAEEAARLSDEQYEAAEARGDMSAALKFRSEASRHKDRANRFADDYRACFREHCLPSRTEASSAGVTSGAAAGTPAAGAAADAPVAAGVGTAGKAATEAVFAGGQGDARMHDAVRDGSSGSVSSREAVAGEGAPGKAYAAEPPLDSRWRLETQHKFEGDSRTTPAGEAAQPVTAVPAGAPDAGGAMRTDAAPGMSPATGTGMSVPGETPATAQDDPVRIATDALWLRPYCPECEEEARAFVEARQAYDELKSVPKELQGEQWAQRMQAAEERLKKAALDYDDCLDEAMCGTPEGLRRQNPCPQCDREWERIARAPTPIEMFKRREEWLECFRQHCPEPLPDRRTSIRSPVPGGAEAVAAAPAQPAQVQCGFPPVQPVVIGPKEEFGNSAEQKALKAGKAVFGIVGGLLGSRGGGGGGGGGFGMPGGFSSGNSGPNLTSNPLRSIMQRFERPDAETAIKAAAKYMDDGKLLISAEVDDSPDDGVVHMVEVQRLVPKADGSGCDTQVQRPGRWLHYAIHEKWWAKLRIQTFVSDGSGWVKTSDTGWMDWGSGTNVLETGKIPANEIPNTGWGSMGADRAMGGPRAAGAYFDPGKPAAYGVPVPERYVVHISRPESDPVTTTPFVFYPVHFADGTVKLSDQEPEQPFIFPGPSPKLPIGGGMTQIDPPHTPETGEDIMEEIDHVPVIAH